MRLERRVRTVLLDQTGLAGMLEGLRRRETLVVRIGVVLKKRSVSGWLAGWLAGRQAGRWATAVVMMMMMMGSDSRVRQQRHDESRGIPARERFKSSGLKCQVESGR